MGLVNKTRGVINSAISDEVIRSVDADRSKLPDWEPEEDFELEPKPKDKKPMKKPALKKSKNKKDSFSEIPAKPKKPRSIADFETWDDDDAPEAPREITVDEWEEAEEAPYPTVDSIGATSPIEEDEDDEMLDDLTSLDSPNEEDAWDPYSEDTTAEYEAPQDSSDDRGYADLPQSTDDEMSFSDTYPDEYKGDDDFDATTLDDPHEDLEESTKREDPMPESIDVSDLPEIETKPSEELISEHSAAPIDLSRAISLEALDEVEFPETSGNGYSKANVDAMMGFMRLSIDLYMRQSQRLQSAIESLADELEERNEQYGQLRHQLSKSIDPETYSASEDERERLEGLVRNYADQLGLNPDEALGARQDGEELFFGSLSTHQAPSDSSEEVVDRADDDSTPTDKDAEEGSEESSSDPMLNWGSFS